jgi:hypothetical protein
MPSWSDIVTHPAEYVIYTASVLVALGVLYAAGSQCAKFIRRVTHALDDLVGEPERPGVKARPGVMERLSGIEERLRTVEADTAQLQRNSGSHLADAIARIEEKLTSSAAADEQS